MITGAHSVIFSRNPEADRAFLKDVLDLPHVDVGGGWLIFALPPAEVAVHPSDENGVHELYLMCDDLHAFRERMRERGCEVDAVEEADWGTLTHVALPGGGRLGVYEPKHAQPQPRSP